MSIPDVAASIEAALRGRAARVTWGLFHMSEAGMCRRRLTYKLLGYEAAPFDRDILSVFEDGRAHEELVISLLLEAGWSVRSRQEEVVLHPDDIGPIVGHIDGVVSAAGEPERLLEVKSMGVDSFARFSRCDYSSFPTVFPEYSAQVQLYMAGRGAPEALVIAKAKASSRVHGLLIPASEIELAWVLARLREVKAAVIDFSLCPRDYADHHCYTCSFSYLCRPASEHVGALPEHLGQMWLHASSLRDEAEEVIRQVREEALSLMEQGRVKRLIGGGVAVSATEQERTSCDWRRLEQLVPSHIIDVVKRVSSYKVVRFRRQQEQEGEDGGNGES